MFLHKTSIKTLICSILSFNITLGMLRRPVTTLTASVTQRIAPISFIAMNTPSVNIANRKYFGSLGAESGAFRATRPAFFSATSPWLMSRKEAFQLLDLPEGSSAEKIKEAFRQKALSIHPDIGGSSKAMQDLNLARDILIGKAASSAGSSYSQQYYKSKTEEGKTKSDDNQKSWSQKYHEFIIATRNHKYASAQVEFDIALEIISRKYKQAEFMPSSGFFDRLNRDKIMKSIDEELKKAKDKKETLMKKADDEYNKAKSYL